MALQGTLKDFGIAEILQLIGQQAKSGVLHLKSKDQEIHILMSDGCVVSAEHVGRKTREMLGSRLVRAGLLGEPQLASALETQGRTLRRLGDILVELGMVSKKDLREMTVLQTTETVYKLFHWKSGTYQFDPGPVEFDADTVTPLRAESLLMEGFRQVDEWPMVRRKIGSTAMTFERLREPDGARAPGEPAAARAARIDAEVDAAFDALEGAEAEKGGEELGRAERKVFALAEPGCSVERIVDLSRLGEFETCKALFNLVNLGYLRPIAAARRSAAAAVGAYARDWPQRLRRGVGQVLVTLAIAAALAGLAYYVSMRGFAWADSSASRAFRDDTPRRFLARYQMGRLEEVLEVYRLERGEYPPTLDALREAGLVAERDLKYPWAQRYYYRRRAEGGFVLLPPIE